MTASPTLGQLFVFYLFGKTGLYWYDKTLLLEALTTIVQLIIGIISVGVIITGVGSVFYYVGLLAAMYFPPQNAKATEASALFAIGMLICVIVGVIGTGLVAGLCHYYGYCRDKYLAAHSQQPKKTS